MYTCDYFYFVDQSQFMSPFVVPNLRCVTVGQPIRCAANPMQSITFLCGASGNPMPTVNVAFTSSTPPVVSGTNISIPSVMSENAGIYTCTAQNQGFADVMRTIQLFVGGEVTAEYPSLWSCPLLLTHPPV